MEKVALQIVNDGVRFVLLDEMQITNISDAMIFKRLAEVLFDVSPFLESPRKTLACL